MDLPMAGTLSEGRRIVLSLLVVQALTLLSVFYLIEVLYFRRALPGWVPILAGVWFVGSVLFLVALRLVPGFWRHLRSFREQAKSLTGPRRTAANIYVLIIGSLGFAVPSALWYAASRSTDLSRPEGYDLSVLAFAAIEFMLLRAYIDVIWKTKPQASREPEPG